MCRQCDALPHLNGMLLRVLTNAHGNDAEAIRPVLNKFIRDIRFEVRAPRPIASIFVHASPPLASPSYAP
jgi:hypothetical protein